MIQNQSILAVIPSRGGAKGVSLVAPNYRNCWATKAQEDLGDGWVHVSGVWERDALLKPLRPLCN